MQWGVDNMAYCTAEDLKSLGYSMQDTDTAYMTQICEMASRSVDAYCHQTFEVKTGQVETHSIRVRNGVMLLFPKNLTVTNIQSITFMAFAGFTPAGTISDAQYLDSRACIIASTDAMDGQYMVKLVYDSGFSTIPSDLTKATVLMAAPFVDDYFLSQEANVSMVKSIKQGDLKIDRADTTTVPQNVTAILNGGNGGLGYVRTRPVS